MEMTGSVDTHVRTQRLTEGILKLDVFAVQTGVYLLCY